MKRDFNTVSVDWTMLLGVIPPIHEMLPLPTRIICGSDPRPFFPSPHTTKTPVHNRYRRVQHRPARNSGAFSPTQLLMYKSQNKRPRKQKEETLSHRHAKFGKCGENVRVWMRNRVLRRMYRESLVYALLVYAVCRVCRSVPACHSLLFSFASGGPNQPPHPACQLSLLTSSIVPQLQLGGAGSRFR